jgi:hypothetical protein
MSKDQIAEQLSAQEDSARVRLDRAAKARHLLDSGLVKEAFDGVEEALLRHIANARLDADISDVRRGLWALKEVKGLLEKHIESGKIAARDIEHIGRERHRLGLLNRFRKVA